MSLMRCGRRIFFPFCALSFFACSDHNPKSSDVQVINESLANVDLDKPGPYGIDWADYNDPSAKGIDRLVHRTNITDVRGRMFMPRGAGPFPLVVFLHGNHQNCDTYFSPIKSDICPPGTKEVPSYAGFDYLARQLASHGYAVMSVNANRGVGGSDGFQANDPRDGALIETRGKLVLKHLAHLSKWNDRGAAQTVLPLEIKGRIDFDHVGLLGHSRGGEGMRAALQQYYDGLGYARDIPHLGVEAVLEIAPVDGYTTKQLDAPGVDWAVFIATCDGDIFDYRGVGTFQRRRLNGYDRFSSIVSIPGANHNQFNSTWYDSDTFCESGEKPMSATTQTYVARLLASAFFQGYVGPQKKGDLQNIFDPQYRMPKQLSASALMGRESMDNATGVDLLEQVAYDATGVTVKAGSANQRYVSLISKDARVQPGSYTASFEPREIEAGGPYGILSLSISPTNRNPSCQWDSSCSKVEFEIQVVYDDGSVSAPVWLHDYFEYERPSYPGEKNILFAEVPIELKDFHFNYGKRLAGVKFMVSKEAAFYFDQTVTLRAAH